MKTFESQRQNKISSPLALYTGKLKNFAVSFFLILLSLSFSFAGIPQNSIRIQISEEVSVEMPVKVEQEVEMEDYQSMLQLRKDSIIAHPVDISTMIKPEKEVDDLDFNTRIVFLQIILEAYISRK